MINNNFLSILTLVINFIHILSAAAWLAGTIIILPGNKIKLNKNIYSFMLKKYKNWTNTLLSILVITGVILILNNLSTINNNSDIYLIILLFKLLLFFWIGLIVFIVRFKSVYFKTSNIYNSVLKLVINEKLIFSLTIIIFLLSEILEFIKL
jgi:putative copper export protein